MTGQNPVQDNRTKQDSLVSVAQAAEVLGISVEAVRKRLQRGQLTGYKTGGSWFVRLDIGQDSAFRPTPSGQDKTTRQERRQAGQDTDLYRQLVDQLRNENDFLKEELRRKDMLLAAFAQRLPQLEPPKPAPNVKASTKRRWWQLFSWGE